VYVESFTLLDSKGKFPDGKSPAVEYIGNGFDPEFGVNFSGHPSKTLKEAQQKFNNSVLDEDVIFIVGHPDILNNTGQDENLTLWKQFIDWIYQKHTLLNINHTEAIGYNIDKNNFTVIRNNAGNYTIDLTNCRYNHNVYLTSPDNDESRWILLDESGNSIGEITGSGFLQLKKGHYYYLTTAKNQPPIFGTPTPSDNSINNPLSFTWSIPINDPNGNKFSWTIQCSNKQTNSGTATSNGIKSLSLSGLYYSTPYIVWVNATDPTPPGSGNWTNGSYSFTTKANPPPVYGTPTPANNSITGLLNLSWSIPITDKEGDKFNWTIECSNGKKSNGSNATSGTKSLALSNLTYLTTYEVWVNATDYAGSGLYNRSWFTFKTKNIPPEQGIPSPTNGSTGNSRTLSWSIPISDEEHFNWTIQCSNGQKAYGSNAITGTKSLALSGLAFSMPYTVWVNATDPTPPGSGNWTNRSYRFTTEAYSGGGGGGTQPSENQKPVADLSAGEPYQGLVNTQITFDGSKSKDPDGTITTWFWVFGDNTSGTGKTVTHTFSKAGTYTVTLTVTDNKNATNTDTTICLVSKPNNRPPTTPTITGPTKGTKNTIYTYTALSTDADNDSIRYAFDWGDPLSFNQLSEFLPNGLVFTVNHSWVAAGRYEVTVNVTDNQTISSSKITVYIDAVQTGDIGYLIDYNGDKVYDAFYSDTTKQITKVQNQKGNYNIDSNGDGVWDYIFSTTNELALYQEPPPNIELIFISGAILLISIWAILVVFWMRKTQKHD
jgi:PKD repeat protein